MVLDIEPINYTNYPLPKREFKKTAQRIFLFFDKLKKFNEKKKYIIELIFLDLNRSKKLNTLKGKNKPANVLAMPEPRPLKAGKNILLGQVFLTPAIIHNEAEKLKISYNFWLRRLFLHGFLHLLGYDHKRAKQAKTMEKLENKILGVL